MITLIINRVAQAVPTLLLLLVLSFLLMRLAPGGPFDAERQVPAAVQQQLEKHYQLDQPLWSQLISYLQQIVQGDLGPSFRRPGFEVSDIIAQGLDISLGLGVVALLVALVLGVLLGSAAASRPNSLLDKLLMGLAITGVSIPTFVLAPLLSLGIAVSLQWLPSGGWGFGDSFGAPKYWVLPVVALALPHVAYIARLLRSELLLVQNSDFIRTAHAKGLHPIIIWWRHALRPALLPVVSYLGPAAAGVLTGSVVVEQVFAIPGIGTEFVDGATTRDYSLVLGVVLVYGVLILLCNLLVDLLYLALDPRLRKSA